VKIDEAMNSKKMTGIITIKGKRYIFRNDDGNYEGIVAWEIDDNISRPVRHKWDKLPRGEVELFDVDNPPKSLGYLPHLN